MPPLGAASSLLALGGSHPAASRVGALRVAMLVERQHGDLRPLPIVAVRKPGEDHLLDALEITWPVTLCLRFRRLASSAEMILLAVASSNNIYCVLNLHEMRFTL